MNNQEIEVVIRNFVDSSLFAGLRKAGFLNISEWLEYLDTCEVVGSAKEDLEKSKTLLRAIALSERFKYLSADDDSHLRLLYGHPDSRADSGTLKSLICNKKRGANAQKLETT